MGSAIGRFSGRQEEAVLIQAELPDDLVDEVAEAVVARVVELVEARAAENQS